MPPDYSKPVYDFQRYLNIRTAIGATLAPKADRIAFLTDITGVHPVWRIDEPGGWPEQLTFYKDRVTFVEWSPTEDLLVFGKDEGGNEKDQIYLLTADGSIITPLTERPEVIHRFGGWSHDGQWIAYASQNPKQTRSLRQSANAMVLWNISYSTMKDTDSLNWKIASQLTQLLRIFWINI